MPILSEIASLVGIADDFSLLDFTGNQESFNRFSNALKQMIDLIGLVDDLVIPDSGLIIPLGSWVIDLNPKSKTFIGKTKLPIPEEVVDSLESIDNDDPIKQLLALLGVDLSTTEEISVTPGGFKFELLSLNSMLDLVLGNPFDIFSFSLPQMDIDLGLDLEFGFSSGGNGLNFGIDGGVKVHVDLGIVYDSTGLQHISDSINRGETADFLDVFDGFYVKTTDGDEVSLTAWFSGDGGVRVATPAFCIPEVDFGLFTSPEICVPEFVAFALEADISLNIKVALDLADPNEDGRLRLDEIFELTQNFDPLYIFNLFDITATLSGSFSASGTLLGITLSTSDLGIGALSFTLEVSLQDILGSFGLLKPPPARLAEVIGSGNDAYLRINAGAYDYARIFGDVDDSDGADITVSTSGSDIVVTGYGTTRHYPSLGITKILAVGREGADLFDLSNMNFDIPVDMKGGAGDDTILGGLGNDTIEGNGGDDADTYVFLPRWGRDTLTETGTDIDVLDFSDVFQNLTFTLGPGTVVSDGVNTLTSTGFGVEDLLGGGGNDTYVIHQVGAERVTMNGGDGSDDYTVFTTVTGEVTVRDNGPAYDRDRFFVFGTGAAETVGLTNTAVKIVPGGEIDYGGAASGLEVLVIDLEGGDDTVRVESTPTTMSVTVRGGDGDDTFDIGVNAADGAAENLNLIFGTTQKGPLTIIGGDDADTLNVFDTTDTAPNMGQLTDTTVTGLGMTVGLKYETIEAVNVDLGHGVDTFAVISTINGPVTVDAGEGDDVITVVDVADSIVVNGQGDNDIITLQGTGLGSTSTLNGDAGNDTINVQTTQGDVLVHGGSEDDTINVGSLAPGVGGTVNDILGTVTIHGDTHVVGDTLNVDDTGDTELNDSTTTDTTIDGLFGGADGTDGRIIYFTIETLNVSLGVGVDIFNVKSTVALTTVNTGVGTADKTVNVGSFAPGVGGTLNAIAGKLVVNGQSSGFETLNVDDTGDGTDNTGTLTRTHLTGLGMAEGIEYSGMNALNVNLGAGDDVFNVLSTDSLTATTLNTGGGSDTIHIAPVGQNLDEIGGPLVIAGDVGPGTITDDIDNLNVFHANNSDVETGKLYARTHDGEDNTGRIISNPGLALTGFGMGGDLSFEEGSTFIYHGGGITYSGLEIVEVLLGQGDETLTISDTGTGTPAPITVIHGGGGDDTIPIIGRGNGPLVVYGDTSESGERYSDPGPADSIQGTHFDNPGNDTIDASGMVENDNKFVGVVAYGGPGNDTITGSRGEDQLAGGSDRDTISGEAGVDHIYGDSHFNVDLQLFARDQISRLDDAGQIRMLIVSANSTGDVDTINGGPGNDVIFGDHGVIGQIGDTRALESTGRLTLVETPHDNNGGGDTIYGDDGNDIIFGGAGNDTIYGNRGSDLIFGDHGSVIAIARDVDPNVIGEIDGAGVENPNAVFTYRSDTSEAADASAGNDTIYGGSLAALDTDTGKNIILGQQGRDIIYGGGSDDDIYGGHNVAKGTDDGDFIDGGAGNDVILGDNGLIERSVAARDSRFAVLEGSLINIDNGRAPIDAAVEGANPAGVEARRIALFDHDDSPSDNDDHFGNDTIAGGADDDVIFGQLGADEIQGDGRGRALLTLTETIADSEIDGDDYIEGNGGRDTIHGGGGQDDIIGGSSSLFSLNTSGMRPDGADVIFGGNGDRTSSVNVDDTSGPGHAHDADTILGDNGNIYRLVGVNHTPGADFLSFGFDNDGSLAIPRAVDLLDTTLDGDAVDIGGDDVIRGESGDDVIHGMVGDDTLYGNGHDDTVYGGPGRDQILGDGGEDILVGGGDADVIDGGAGDDLIFGDHVRLDRTFSLEEATDPRFRSLTGEEIYDADGNPQVGAEAQADPAGRRAWSDRAITLLGHSAEDQARGGNSFGDDYIAGGGDDDMIFGQLGDDTIQGDGSVLFSQVSDDAPLTSSTRVSAARDANGLLLLVPSDEDATDGDDYIEGNGGNDVIFGNLGQDDIVGGSSSLFSLTMPEQRPDGEDILFGGAGTGIGRNNIGDASESGHARDADTILGDNGNIYRLVGVDGMAGAGFGSFNYDNYGPLKVIPRAFDLLDYTPGDDAADIGGSDLALGESGDDVVHGMVGNDVLYGNGQDDDLYGGTGHDRIFGGAGVDGIIADDGVLLTSRNGLTEPLNGVTVANTQTEIGVSEPFTEAVVDITGLLKKDVHLLAWDIGGHDIVYGGLGDDWIHAGAGDDAISGAEALPEFYNNTAPQTATPPIAYDPLTQQLEFYDANDPHLKIDGFLLNFEASDLAGIKIEDGNDRIFGDLGNDWLVGGTGVDRLFGGLGDDLINADANHDNGTTPGSNDVADDPDFAGGDLAFGGRGLDVLIANADNDRMFDWRGGVSGEFYFVPFSPAGDLAGDPAGVPARSPEIGPFLRDLGRASGADQSLTEPNGELGLDITIRIVGPDMPIGNTTVEVQLDTESANGLSGVLAIRFDPSDGLRDDPNVGFSTGQTANFAIAPGEDSSGPLAVNVGTIAGEITITAEIDGGERTVVQTIQVPRRSPVITDTLIEETPTGFNIRVTGYSTTLEVVEATFQFEGAEAQIESVSVGSAFQSWYANPDSVVFGSRFEYVQPVTVNGDRAAARSVTLRLRNSQGVSEEVINL